MANCHRTIATAMNWGDAAPRFSEVDSCARSDGLLPDERTAHSCTLLCPCLTEFFQATQVDGLAGGRQSSGRVSRRLTDGRRPAAVLADSRRRHRTDLLHILTEQGKRFGARIGAAKARLQTLLSGSGQQQTFPRDFLQQSGRAW